MDPWLEHPALWPDVHNRLIVAIADEISSRLAPNYFVGVETRTTILTREYQEREVRPDLTIRPADLYAPGAERGQTAVLEVVETEAEEAELPGVEEVEEWYLEIRGVPTRQVVTVIELLSPTNKLPGEGRGQYVAKRNQVLRSQTSLVEIDLLRGGLPMPLKQGVPPSDYRVLVSRAGSRPKVGLYRFGLRAHVPTIPIPLLPGEGEPLLELNRILHQLIERAAYYVATDYDQAPEPPLRKEDGGWADAILKEARESETRTGEPAR
jgi:hypothetical protein